MFYRPEAGHGLLPRYIQVAFGWLLIELVMLAAGLPIGKSLAEPDLLDAAKAVMAAMKARGAEVPVPTDVVVAKTFAADAPTAQRWIAAGAQYLSVGVDVGIFAQACRNLHASLAAAR